MPRSPMYRSAWPDCTSACSAASACQGVWEKRGGGRISSFNTGMGERERSRELRPTFGG